MPEDNLNPALENEDDSLASFFEDDEPAKTDKIEIDPDEYNRYKQLEAEQALKTRQPEPEPAQNQQPTQDLKALEEFVDNRAFNKGMEAAAIAFARNQYPELVSHEEVIAPFIARASREAATKGESLDPMTAINRGIKAYHEHFGKPQPGISHITAMNPDIRSAPKAKENKLTANAILDMPDDKFAEMDRKIGQKLARGERVTF